MQHDFSDIIMSNYHPEPYWSDVAKRIDSRGNNNVIAGDDEPYYRYKKARFLEMLLSLDFSGKSVLEIGSGPGGNLKMLMERAHAKSLTGADISQAMINLAQPLLPGVDLVKIDGTTLPFEDSSFDYIFTATVLQHNTDEVMLTKLIKEICRVSNEKVILFERIESSIKGDELCYGRPVKYYRSLIEAEGFELVNTSFINIRVSFYVCGAIRKLFNPSSRKEGEPLTKFSWFLQTISLPLTKVLDKIFRSKKDIAKLEFRRK